jgi:hypothetical protein
MAAEFDDFKYPDPVQVDGMIVTRQKGLAPAPQGGIDPVTLPPVIQGSPDIFTSRNTGPHVTQRFGADGTLEADRRADDAIMFADHPLSDPEALPPGLARTNAPLPAPSAFGEMTAVQQREAIRAQAEALGFVVTEAKDSPTVFDVIASDGGSADPRDMSTGPQVLSALPVIKKAPIVPVTVSVAPKAKDAPKVKK